MLDKIEVVHRHELVSLEVHPQFIRFEFGSVSIAMSEFAFVFPGSGVETFVKASDGPINFEAISRLAHVPFLKGTCSAYSSFASSI